MSIIENFKNVKIAVFGDVMLDKYITGEVERISPEAPIPIVTVNQESFAPGGAANTACNVATLTAQAFLFGVVGKDEAQVQLIKESQKYGIQTQFLMENPTKRTIQKIRVLSKSQQLLRVDYEDIKPISSGEEAKIFESISGLPGLNGLIISDYSKGSLTEKLMKRLIDSSQKNKVRLIVDPKPFHKAWYDGCFLMTPNKKEAEAMAGFRLNSTEEINRAGKILQDEYHCHVLITLGEKGMSLFEKGKDPLHIPTVASEVYDVSGAGDTVVAAMTVALCAGADFPSAARLANQAAGIKVRKLGTAPVHLEEIQEVL